MTFYYPDEIRVEISDHDVMVEWPLCSEHEESTIFDHDGRIRKELQGTWRFRDGHAKKLSKRCLSENSSNNA